MSTSDRKIEHLLLCLEKDVEAHRDRFGFSATGFPDIELIHKALPEISKKDINLSIEFLGKKLNAPVLFSSMTGGHPDTIPVNSALAEAAEELGVGIGVGSQRAALENPDLEDSFRIVRDKAPHTFIYGNIGAAQLKDIGIEGVEKTVSMIGADALAIHLNFLQEAIQPEGDTNAAGCLDAIRKVCREIKVPVIVKETGAGISKDVASELCNAGVSAIDIGGMGGTSWAGVEVYRAQKRSDKLSEHLGKLYWNWGIPTAVSIVESNISVPLIATGGIRNGMDIAKSIALGASLCGIALPLVAPALKGKNDVIDTIRYMIEELKIAMFLTGSSTIKELAQVPLVITGRTKDALEQRGFDIRKLSNRNQMKKS